MNRSILKNTLPAAALVVAAQPSPNAEPTLTSDDSVISTIFEADSSAGQFSLRNHGDGRVTARLKTADGAPEVSFESYVLGYLQGAPSLVRVDRSRHVAAASSIGDLANRLVVWDLGSDGLEGDLVPARFIERLDLVREDGQREVAVHIESPCLLQRGLKTLLFGSAIPLSRPFVATQRIVFVAELDGSGEVLAARYVCEGYDPRAVVVGDEVLLAVRRGTTLAETIYEAPVQVLRTTDLATWLPDERASATAAVRPEYALAATGRDVWLASWTDEPDRRTVVQHFEARRGEWVEQTDRSHPLPDGTPVLTLVAGEGDGMPRLVFVGQDGRLSRD